MQGDVRSLRHSDVAKLSSKQRKIGKRINLDTTNFSKSGCGRGRRWSEIC